MAAMENSHRFLIILTYEYIKDDWKLFQLQQVNIWHMNSSYRNPNDVVVGAISIQK